MASEPQSRITAWFPLVAVAGVLVLVVGFALLAIDSSGGSENTVSAEAVPADRVQPRPTATPAPIPTPSIVTPAGTVEAPGFRGIVQWINSDPLVLEEQRGKVVLIDFWTYS